MIRVYICMSVPLCMCVFIGLGEFKEYTHVFYLFVITQFLGNSMMSIIKGYLNIALSIHKYPWTGI